MNVYDFKKSAEASLSKEVLEFINLGADDNITYSANSQAFEKIFLKPKVLCGVKNVDTGIKLLGNNIDMPILIAPTAHHGLLHVNNELESAQAANTLNTIMVASTISNVTMEEIKLHAQNAWFQLYMFKSKELTSSLIKRAENSGYQALVITVDVPLMGNREHDKRNSFSIPENLKIANLHLDNINNNVINFTDTEFKNDISWDDIAWIKSISKLPIILKGILHPEDAKMAMDIGVDSIIVSNHGGRQLDTAVPTILALPKIVEVVDNKIPILIDGGIYRGTSVLKSLCLGATAVLVGRPVLWGLATSGKIGIENVINSINNELKLNMRLCGFSNIEEIYRHGKSIIFNQ